jgi:hypothetical protein
MHRQKIMAAAFVAAAQRLGLKQDTYCTQDACMRRMQCFHFQLPCIHTNIHATAAKSLGLAAAIVCDAGILNFKYS